MNLLWNLTIVCGGANKKDAHYVNINPKRDFNVEDIIVHQFV